jgi:hypothetical protein
MTPQPAEDFQNHVPRIIVRCLRMAALIPGRSSKCSAPLARNLCQLKRDAGSTISHFSHNRPLNFVDRLTVGVVQKNIQTCKASGRFESVRFIPNQSCRSSSTDLSALIIQVVTISTEEVRTVRGPVKFRHRPRASRTYEPPSHAAKVRVRANKLYALVYR